MNPGEIYDPLDEAPAPIPIVEYQEITAMYTNRIPTNDMSILITGNAADISCMGKGFQVLFNIGETTWAGMALAKAQTNVFDIVTVAAVVIDPNMSRNILIIINQAAYIPDLE